MANTKKQGAMVLHEEGMTAPALAPPPTSAPSLFVVLKQVHLADGLKDKANLLAISEANSIMKSAINSAATNIHPTSSMALSDTTAHPENMPADVRCKGVAVTLDNNSMWNEFCRCQTEMILTKQGRRMFPYCRFRLSGMEPFQSYLLAMDIVPVDNHRYKWSGKGWETNGKADPHVSRLFVHPESPATGLHWMQYPVLFYRLKLCNNTLDQEGHIILHSMHRYLPRLHIIPADKASGDIQIDRPDVITLSFSQTEFFAVTAYQNLCITQLKIDYNPFAKGFREDAVNARSTKAKNGVSVEESENEPKPSKETTTLNNLKTLFMKRNAAVAAKANKDQNVHSPTNGEKKVVISEAPVVDKDKSTKKRPLPGAFSDFLKGAHVKVKRLSLDNIDKNGVVLQTATACTSEKQEVEAISSKSEKLLEAGETVMDDIPKCNNTDTSPKTEIIKLDDNKILIDEHNKDQIKLLPSDQKVQNSDKKERENLSLDTEAKPETKTKKTIPHKRPEPVPLPLLAQFLKQRKSKVKSTTQKPEAPNSTLESKPQLTPKNSLDLTSSTPSANTHIDSQLSHTASCQTVISSSAADTHNLTSISTTLLSSPSLPVDSLLEEEADEPLRFSPSSSTSDSFHAYTTSPAKTNFDPALDSISNVFGISDADVSMQDLDNTLMSQSDISSVFTCSVLDDTHSPTKPAVNTVVAIISDTPTVITSPNSVFDVPSSKNSEVVPSSSMPQVESESVSDCLLENSNDLCSELFTQDALDTNDESLSLPLDDPPSPTFSLPSPAPSSPDPFPPDLFSDRPVPPRKTLDDFPERLLDCTGISSSDLISLLCDIPEGPSNHPDSFQSRLLNGPVDLMPTSFQKKSGLFNDSIDLFCQGTADKPSPVNDVQETVNVESSETAVSDQPVPEPNKQSSNGSTLKKSNKKQKKVGKLKHGEDDEVFEGPIPAPMQPSLEDVEGQLFVSFVSKTALEIHLGDAKTEAAQKTLETSDGDRCGSIEEKIKVLEKELLHDLNLMKYRQVIHPVLQEVGLKLNLLDMTLAIDLQYLGVQLPIPPHVLLPEESSASSKVQYVSRTGKTTDITKIKGWRDKFAGSGSVSEGVSSVDAGQNNLSAFCSDMLDEYLASEGKLIDERAANLSQMDTTPVAYQLPTKSTSYVRTLDSVLKKQVPPSLSSASKHPSPTSRKAKPMFVSKVVKKSKRNLKSDKEKQVLTTPKPVTKPGGKFTMNLNKAQQSKTYNIGKEAKSLSTEKVVGEIPAVVASVKTPRLEESTAASCTAGRSPGLPKTLVKLMDVEDGAVWEGKRRTCITEERAAIALTALVTAESATKANPDAMRIIKRRAPPCLNVFCRLGCLCASLLHLRRHHHCGKPECMLGCSCLRRKVIALKSPKEEGGRIEEPEPQSPSEEKTKWKKIKKRKTYVITDPEAAPEPAKRVSTLWDPKRQEYDSEIIFCPPPSRVLTPPLLSKDLQHESNFSRPKQKRVGERNLSMNEESSDSENNQTCSRVRPFRPCRNKLKTVQQPQIPQVSTQDIEEGELVPPLSGPIKRLEIVSGCSWSSTASRNDVMRMVCMQMAQDRLKNPFWIGKYYIQLISKTVQETEEGCVHTYKVNISEPVEKKKKDEDVAQNDVKTESIQPVEKIEVKGLPFLARCSPAGLLKAEKKAPNTPGQIMVNGKPYPQAKLELGKMGALHPANRLAAYITGRICPVSQPVTTSTTEKASATVPVTSEATVTSVTSTSASSTTSSSTTTSPVKTAVTKPPVGQVFTQFVANHVNSQNQASLNTPQLKSPPKIVIPSSLLMVGREAGAPGVTLSPLKPGLATQVSKPSVSKGSISLPTVSKFPTPTITILNKSPSLPMGAANVTPTSASSSVSPTSGKKTVFITVVSRSTGATSSGPQVAKSITQVRPSQTSGQKMMLQVVKTADGNTLYRNPSGQLVRLVPLSQIKSMSPDILPKGPATMFRLSAPNVVSPSKPQSGSTITVTSPSPTNLTQPKTTVTVPAATSLSGKPVTLTTSKSVTFNSFPSIKVTPTFLGQSGTCTLRILPPNTLKDTVSSTPTSSPSLSQGGFTLLKPTGSTLQNQDSTKSTTSVSVSSDSTEGSVSQGQPILDLSKRSDMVSAKQDSADDKISESLAGNMSQTGNPSNSSHREPGELDHSGLVANPSVKEIQFDTDLQEEEIGSDGSELTDDSDLYSDDDQDDSYSDSDKEELGPVEEDDDGSESEMKGPAEVVVDIESFEESVEKVKIALLRESARNKYLHHRRQKNNEGDDEKMIKKVHKERVRRCTLRERLINLQLTLKNPLEKMSKNRILTLAQEEIETLVQQESLLVMNKHTLGYEREKYLKKLSVMSDKSVESISQKLNEIIAKQKSLEAQNEAREMKSERKPKRFLKSTDPSSEPKSSALQKVKGDVPKLTQSPSKPIDLSLKKQRSLETPECIIEDSTSKPKEPNSSRSTPTTLFKDKSSLSIPLKPIADSIHLNDSAHMPIPITPISRERMRPNILLRSQTTPVSSVKEPLVTNVCIPQVIPLNTMIPFNQIITLNKPLGITSLGQQQSTTPGVASVSISVPGMSRPPGVENADVPMLQPQYIKITNSPDNFNTQVEPVNLSNVSKNVVVSQPVVLEKTDTTPAVQAQPISVHSHLEERGAVEGKPKDAPKQSVDGLDKKGQENSNDPEDENLMSLLDELVLLSQQLSNDPEPTNEDQNDVIPDKVSSQSDRQVDTNRDDDRELSPLFLTLDEDMMSPACSKDEIDDIPPKVDDLVKVIFGSDSPTVSSDSGVATSTNAQSPQPPTSNVTSDALTPPPLLHMKAACGAVSGQPASEGANVAWRPMPKLVPLGLKAQDAVLNKVNSSSVLKLDSKDVQKPHP